MYKKIILKLSGEVIGSDGEGIDFGSIDRIISEIMPLYRNKISVGIVTGGGNIWRGSMFCEHVDKTMADYIGMTVTLVNGLILKARFEKLGVPAEVYSSFQVGNIIDQFTIKKINYAWQENKIVILAGGTGRPHFTTDTASAVFAVEMKVDAVLKATDVDGVYDSDPVKNPNAKMYERVSFDEVINKNLRVMDAAAFSLCRDHKIPIIVFNYKKDGNIVKAASGEKTGTLVYI